MAFAARSRVLATTTAVMVAASILLCVNLDPHPILSAPAPRIRAARGTSGAIARLAAPIRKGATIFDASSKGCHEFSRGVSGARMMQERRGWRSFAQVPPVPFEPTSIPFEPMAPVARIPVTIVTGFLGSGKTTLLNNILTKDHGKRIAVIENEYGEIGIDGELVALRKEGSNDDSNSIMMLSNGCLCCVLRDDLVKMMMDLTTRYKGKFNHIVIETTGLAAIAPIIHSFYSVPELAERIDIDGVVTLVDAKHITRHLDEKDGAKEPIEQLAYADRIVMNKMDLITEDEAEVIEERIRAINSLADIVRAEKANVGVDYVLGVGGFDLNKADALLRGEEKPSGSGCSSKKAEPEEKKSVESVKSEKSEIEDKDTETKIPEAVSSSGCSSKTKTASSGCSSKKTEIKKPEHTDRVSSVSVTIDGDVEYDKIDEWLGSLLSEIHDNLYRMKGILAVKGFPEKYVFQGVHALFEGTPHDMWKEGEKRVSKIVFIGRDLPVERIKEGFMNCQVIDDPATVDIDEPIPTGVPTAD